MPISTDRGLAGALQVSASTIAADRKRIALSAKDFTVNRQHRSATRHPINSPASGATTGRAACDSARLRVPIRSQPRRRLPPHGGSFATSMI